MRQELSAMQAQRQDLSEVRRILQEVVDHKPKRRDIKRLSVSRRLSVAHRFVKPNIRKLAGLAPSDVFVSDSSSSSNCSSSRSSSRSTVHRTSGVGPRHSSIFQEHFEKKKSSRVPVDDDAEQRIAAPSAGSLGPAPGALAQKHLGDDLRTIEVQQVTRSWPRTPELQ
mmetsp:Transcript_40679/g.109181  ORF Transcript_40679/g.109181 Transcript_40679/m.109181 type:complete len:168 (+) Transcript_40679:564-1067(+)